MFRCHPCKSLVKFTYQEPRLLEFRYDPQMFVVARFKLYHLCDRCGAEVANYELTMDQDVTTDVIVVHSCPNVGLGDGWSVELKQLGKFVKLVPPNRTRFVTYYGVEILYFLKCQCPTTVKLEKIWSGQVAARFMHQVSRDPTR